MAGEAYAVAIPSRPAGLIPVAKSKTYKARDGNVGERIRLDVTDWMLDEVREALVGITGQEMEGQIRIDNPPAFASVDGVRGRGIAFAQRRVVVSFGVRLKMQALNDLKAGLKSAIAASTQRVTGALADMGNWKFFYIRNGKRTQLPLSGASGIPLGPRDFIILMPVGVHSRSGAAHATAVNMRVAGSGQLSFKRSARGRVAKKNQSIGFLALTARAAAASAQFSGFNVLAGFTSKYAVRGEVVGKGKSSRSTPPIRTGFIKISPKLGKRAG